MYLDELMKLFLRFMEATMMGQENELLQCNEHISLVERELAEDEPASTALIFQGGTIELLEGGIAALSARGYVPCCHDHLTTHQVLCVTRALATFHASSRIPTSKYFEVLEDPIPGKSSLRPYFNNDNPVSLPVSSSADFPSDMYTKGNYVCKRDACDVWTAQVTRVDLVRSNLTILTDRLKQVGASPATVTRLEALQGDLATLTQFVQFASALQPKKVRSVGPVSISDIWFDPEDEEAVGIEVYLGLNIVGSPLRDPAWVWLTLLQPDLLRDRYLELCDQYCSAFNKTLERLDATDESEELSYFDAMQDLGENFLVAFLTIVHKFVVSGRWFSDRRLDSRQGILTLAEMIAFLVDNGIVGSIFVL